MAVATQTAWGAKIDELLADGAWHDVEAVLVAAAQLVPPGRAYRNGERRRTNGRGDGRTAPAQRVQGDRAVAVATGARELARQALRSRVRRGTAERDGDRVRRRP